MYKVKSCCINGCKNQNIGPDSGVIFYKFPDEKPLKKRWVEACLKNDTTKDKNWTPNNETVICNVHFVTGHKNANDWHPDYVPSVFRSLRRVITKAKGKHLDDSEDESKIKKVLPMAKRASLATPTRNTPKNRTPSLTSAKKMKLKPGRPKKVVLVKEEALISTTILDQPKKLPVEGKNAPCPKSKKIKVTDETEIDHIDISEKFSNDEDSKDLRFSEAGRPIRNKRKRLDDDFVDDTGPVLKTLSVVLERTSDKKIKLSTGEITIKEEPESETDYLLSPSSEVSFESSKKVCKKCFTLEQKIKRLESSLKNSPGTDKCRRCPVIEGKLSKVEEELDQIIDAKVSKCQKCSLIDQKCKRIDNNLRKTQSEVNKLLNKLSNIELNEETLKKYKNKVRMYTGFPNYEALMLVFDHLKSHFPVDTVKVLTPFQMFIIVLMRLKLNFPFWDLTYRFGCSPNHIQSFYPQYIGVLETQLSHVVLWPKANLFFRLEVLASNLRQSFALIKDNVEVNTLIMANDGKLNEEEKTVRVCAALYHISQLVSSNHSQQLMRILNSKDETDRASLLQNKNTDVNLDAKEETDDKLTPQKPVEEEITPKNSVEHTDSSFLSGNEDVDDSDIFFEDLTKDLRPGVNSNDSLKLECKHLRKELENLNQKLALQFRFYTGMRNFEVFNNLLGFLQSHVSHISTDKLSHFQQLHLVLIRLKLNLEVQDISHMFNVDPDHVVYLTRLWIDVIVKKLSRYIDWPAGVEDLDGEKRLLGTVKLKYQILWSPNCAPRNKETGREKERFDSHQLLRACAALYNIDDIEVFKDGRKESKLFHQNESLEEKTNDELEQMCRELRTELYDLRKSNMSSIITCFTEENFRSNDQMVQFYSGFPSYDMLMNIFTLIVPVTKSDTRKAVPPFQQFLVLLLRMKLNLATQDLGFRFGMGHSNTHKIIQDWLILLHSQLAPHITWPDDDEDVEVFTDMLRKTYAYLRNHLSPRRRDCERKSDTGCFDIATLVCAGLYNIGEVSFCEQSDSEFESFDEEW
ncbi:UNVERIFIED_CONTAM: hypothetical protein RMT77_007673 [Armadillidium vulgare]